MGAITGIQVGGIQYELKPNSKEAGKSRTWWDRFTDLTGTGSFGSFRLMQFADRVLSLANRAFPQEGIEKLAKMARGGWTVTVFSYLPRVTEDAIEGAKEAWKPGADKEVKQREYVKAFSKGAEAVSVWGYASSMVLACFKKTADVGSAIFKVADVVGFAHDVAELGMNVKDCLRAYTAELVADPKDREDLNGTKRHYFLGTVKGVCAVASVLLGVGMAVSGLALPQLVVAGAVISLAGTILAMASDLHKEGLKNKPIDFSSPMSRVA